MSKIKNKLRKCFTGGLIALSALASSVKADINGDIGYLFNDKVHDSYVETNFKSNLPFDVKMSGYLDLQSSKKGYFGKISFIKDLSEDLSLRLQTIHLNEPLNEIGLGLRMKMPSLSKDTYAGIHFMPAWFSSKGFEKGKIKMGYFVSQKLPREFYAWCSGEFNPVTNIGPQWIYGEAELGRQIGNLSIGINTALKTKGKIIPKLDPRFSLRYGF